MSGVTTGCLRLLRVINQVAKTLALLVGVTLAETIYLTSQEYVQKWQLAHCSPGTPKETLMSRKEQRLIWTVISGFQVETLFMPTSQSVSHVDDDYS